MASFTKIALGTVLGVLAWGLVEKFSGFTFAEARTALVDGDVDGARRDAALRSLQLHAERRVQRGRAAIDAEALRLGVAAAVLRADVAGFDRLRFLAPGSPWLPGGQALAPDVDAGPAIAAASLHEASIAGLFRGWVAENRGQATTARSAYEQARRAALLAQVPLADQLAREGLDRLR